MRINFFARVFSGRRISILSISSSDHGSSQIPVHLEPVKENQVSPIKGAKLFVCGAVRTRSCVHFCNEKDLPLTCGADYLHMHYTGQVLENNQRGSVIGRAI